MSYYLLSTVAALALGLQTPPQAPQLEEVFEWVDEEAAALVEDGITVGMVIGTLRGEESLVRGYGELKLGGGQVPDAETVYEIGSVSKVFTGVLLADAVTRELLTLDDTVQSFYEEVFTLPSFEDQPIRLWHLSTHTSGLPRMPGNFKPASLDDPYADYSLELLYENLAKYRPRRAPGQRLAYSNLGVGLLGNIVARAQASDYASVLRARITGPLKMANTAIQLSPWMRAHLATGYDVDRREAANWNLPTFAGAGGIRSNVDDLLRFARACLQPEESPLEAALELSMEVKHRDESGAKIALGWFVDPGESTRWHSGQTGGYHTFFAIWPAGDVAVVMMANTSSALVDLVADSALLMLMGHEPHEISYPKAIELDRAACEQYVGEYQLGFLSVLTVTLEEAGLYAQISFQPKFRIYPSSADTFFYRSVEAEITFKRDEEGEVNGLRIKQNGAVTKGRRK